jgi:hypothetical protein
MDLLMSARQVILGKRGETDEAGAMFDPPIIDYAQIKLNATFLRSEDQTI